MKHVKRNVLLLDRNGPKGEKEVLLFSPCPKNERKNIKENHSEVTQMGTVGTAQSKRIFRRRYVSKLLSVSRPGDITYTSMR
jgi:hypothetical protein